MSLCCRRVFWSRISTTFAGGRLDVGQLLAHVAVIGLRLLELRPRRSQISRELSSLPLERRDALPRGRETPLGDHESLARDRLGSEKTSEDPAFGPLIRDAHTRIPRLLVLFEDLDALARFEVAQNQVLGARPAPYLDDRAVRHIARLGLSQ